MSAIQDAITSKTRQFMSKPEIARKHALGQKVGAGPATKRFKKLPEEQGMSKRYESMPEKAGAPRSPKSAMPRGPLR